MPARPRADIGSLLVGKGAAAASAPFQAPVPAVVAVPPVAPASSHPELVALTVKLDRPTYLRLKSYCLRSEAVSGQRITHQAVAVRALVEFLDRQGA